ncbi:MAG: hypothetical protein BIFFINMI_00506 [Phycisphaerae bacterium]|nr:hypothetical protein [Phycisphaerae bacterium]
MAKRKTKRAGAGSRSGSSSGKRGPLIDGWWSRLSDQSKRRAVRFCLHVAFIAVLAGGLVYGLHSMERYVHSLASPSEKIMLVMAPPPEWMAPSNPAYDELQSAAEQTVNRLAASVGGDTARTWFDPKLAPNIAHALGSHPYVSRVTQVEKRLVPADDGKGGFRREIVMAVEYRRPLAQVWWQSRLSHGPGRWYVLDKDGFVLSSESSKRPALPSIVPAPSPQPQVGGQLGVAAIQAGLDLVSLLSDRPYFNEICEVDVGNFGRPDPDAAELVLRVWSPVDRYSSVQEIKWGYRLGNPDRGEMNDTKGKLVLLREIWTTYKTLNLSALRVVDGPIDLYSVRGEARANVVPHALGPGRSALTMQP